MTDSNLPSPPNLLNLLKSVKNPVELDPANSTTHWHEYPR